MSAFGDQAKTDFTLDAMLMRRDSAEHAHDEAERVHLVAQFSSYADAFVAHVPENQAEAFESVLLARYLTFLPDADEDIAAAIREPLETALTDLFKESGSAVTSEALFRALSLAREAAAEGKWVEDETDLPRITVVRNVITWARGALMA